MYAILKGYLGVGLVVVLVGYSALERHENLTKEEKGQEAAAHPTLFAIRQLASVVFRPVRVVVRHVMEKDGTI